LFHALYEIKITTQLHFTALEDIDVTSKIWRPNRHTAQTMDDLLIYKTMVTIYIQNSRTRVEDYKHNNKEENPDANAREAETK